MHESLWDFLMRRVFLPAGAFLCVTMFFWMMYCLAWCGLKMRLFGYNVCGIPYFEQLAQSLFHR